MRTSGGQIGVWFPTIQAGTGADVFTERLAKALDARGFRTEITWLPHRAEYLPWSVPAPKPPEGATVAHVNSWLPKRFIPRNLPLVVTVHHCVHDPLLRPYKSYAQNFYHQLWVRRQEARALHAANAITTVSHYTKERIQEFFRLENVHVIHNWVDSTVFTPCTARAPHSPFRLLFVGSMQKRKGVDLLDRIMRTLGEGYELRCTCAPNILPRFFSEETNVVALGRMNSEKDLARVYNDCDALLFPSRLEGFGLVALEAQACGTPVITTDGSALPEVVKNGITGFLCPQDDIDAFAQSARLLQADSELWQVMHQAARTHAQENFNEDEALNAYLKIYTSLYP